MNSPVTDLLIRLKNGYLAEKSEVTGIYSALNKRILEILKEHKYIDTFEVIDENNKQHFVITLKYNGDTAAMKDVRLISTPGRKLYAGVKEIPSVRGGLGMAVLSTSKGVLTGKQAIENGVGGQVLFYIW